MPRKVLTTLDLNGPLTLTGASGTTGQILVSGGTGTPTWTSSPNLNNPLLTRVDATNEGGQLNFARSSDGAQYWYIDTFGSTSTPDLRFIENTSERFRIAAGGVLYINGSAGTNGQVLTSSGTGSAPTWTTVSGGSFTGGTLTSNLTLAAGTASLSPLTFQSGTNLTSVTAGAREYDGTVFYQTSNTTPGRALEVQNYYYATPAAGYTLAADTNLTNSVLGGVSTGITLVAGTTYEVELLVNFQHSYFGDTSRTFTQSWNASTVSGSPTVSWNYVIDYGSNTTSFATATTLSSALISSAATAVTISASIASGSRYVIYKVKGILRITGTGSIKFFPQITVSSLLVSNSAIVGAGSFFKLTPIGNGTVTSVGTWA